MNNIYIKNKIILTLIIANLVFAVGCESNKSDNSLEEKDKYNISLGGEISQEEETPEFEIYNKRNENVFFISYGLKNLEGDVVLEANYSSIEPLGKDRVAVTRIDNNYQTLLAPKALFSSKGEQLSEYMYYYIGIYENGVAFVNTENESFYIDKSGNRVEGLPSYEGRVSLEKSDDELYMFKGTINGIDMYIDDQGVMTYADDKMLVLESGEQIEKMSYHPNYAVTSVYPKILSNDTLGSYTETGIDKINQYLYDEFVNDYEIEADGFGVYADSYNSIFNIVNSSKALVVQKEGYYMPLGAAHGHPKCQYINFDKSTGEAISYYDLFTDIDRTVDAAIVESINKKIDEHNKDGKFYDLLTDEMGSFNVAILDEGFAVRFQAYEIAPYSAGMPEFYVSYDDLPPIKE